MVNGRTIAEDMEREYQRQSLRDTFAAAALTGLLARPDVDADFCCEDAYKWADAMLRERDKTSVEKTSGSGSVTPADRDTTHPRNGALGEPVAWAVVHANGFGGIVDCYTTKQLCEYHFSGPHFRYVPLYRHPQPTLTTQQRPKEE